MDYKEEEYLQLSGIQHFLFCRRQWALIHIEQQWKENARTVDGMLMHKNVHDSELRTKRGDILTVRGMRVHSSLLGISGECDAVEFHRDENGIPLAETDGLWIPYPVEYKRGTPKADAIDEVQLCAQAMCLEEMLCCNIEEGALYYGETRRRNRVLFSEELRTLVKESLEEMHALYRKGHTPAPRRTKSCNACSLKDLCLPGLKSSFSVEEYLRIILKE